MIRVDGYAPIAAYAAIGDGRTVALVARDGSVDWLALPALDGVTVFGALLDVERGGSFSLAPIEEFEVERRYVPDSNVLETTFTTESGIVTVADALTLQDGGQLSWVELVRRIRGVRGRVRLRHEIRPRFDFGRGDLTIERRKDALLARGGDYVLAFRCWDAGEPTFSGEAIGGVLEAERGSDGLLVCSFVKDEPIPLPDRHEIEIRFDRTAEAWQRWLEFHTYEGDWEQAVERSALALKLLVYAPSGAIAAAPTTSLPERIGGDLNWDYRFAWIRDSAFTLDALGNLGYREQVHASLSWLLRASNATHPRMEPFYRLDGSVPRLEAELDLAGYRGSRPVRKGNGASGQLQLGCYGDLLETIALYVQNGNTLDAETGIRLAEVADHVCRIWGNEDSGIWELQQARHYTMSKISCWVALDRALRLAAQGEAPDDHAEAWREEAGRIRAWIDERCWSEARQSYAFYAGGDDLDAALLLAVRVGYLPADDPRLLTTLDAIRRELGAGGPLLYRYTGQAAQEGAFLACSFWLVEALARTGRLDEARATMEELLALGNDVGLYSEEIEPASGEFLGNFPQGLTHLALINAAVAVERAAGKRGRDL
ncbi:MAG: glycoside hydrolase family 15 protein [Gaiellaceae bacterium]